MRALNNTARNGGFVFRNFISSPQVSTIRYLNEDEKRPESIHIWGINLDPSVRKEEKQNLALSLCIFNANMLLYFFQPVKAVEKKGCLKKWYILDQTSL